jgi:hypothetical protein
LSLPQHEAAKGASGKTAFQGLFRTSGFFRLIFQSKALAHPGEAR